MSFLIVSERHSPNIIFTMGFASWWRPLLVFFEALQDILLQIWRLSPNTLNVFVFHYFIKLKFLNHGFGISMYKRNTEAHPFCYIWIGIIFLSNDLKYQSRVAWSWWICSLILCFRRFLVLNKIFFSIYVEFWQPFIWRKKCWSWKITAFYVPNYNVILSTKKNS